MSSWKKTGGINYSSKFNTIRVQNAVASSSSVIKEIGEKNTVTNIKSDLHFKEDSSLFSVENVLDNRGLVAFYEFTDISGADTQLGTNGVIENKATFDYGNDLGQFDHSILDLEIVDISGADISGNKDIIEVGPNKDLQVENILVPDSLLTEKAAFTHFNKFLRFEGKTPENPTAAIMVFNNTPCKSLISKQSIEFNNYHVTDLITGGERTDPDMSLVSGKYTHHNTLSVICWMRINKYDAADNNPTDPTGFMLFSLDDDVQGPPTQGDERLCFWAPGYKNNGSPQVHFGGLNKSGNGLGSESNEKINDINVQTDVQIPYNKWTLISLVIKGNRAYIYQEADETHKLTQEIYIGDYRLPEKKIIVNGTRFYNMDVFNNGASADWIPNNTQTSTMSIDIADFKVYNYAIDSHTIKRLYENDNPFFNETINFRIEPDYMKIGNDVVVGNDAHINHDLTISNDLKTFGVSETYNNAFVAGSLGVGVKEHDPDYRLNVLGNLKTTGDIYLGDGSSNYNGIFFRGVGSPQGENPRTTRLVERVKGTDSTYSELLLSKGTDVEHPDIIDNDDKLISDSIRLRAPNVYIDTFDGVNGTDPNQDTSRFVFSKDGFLGIKSVEPKAELDIRGTIHLTDHNTFNNIFITNEGTNVSSGNNPARNIGIGQGVLQTPNFGNLQGDNNVAIGPESSSNLVTGSNNVAVGNKTLKNNMDGSDNVAIGNESLINSNTDNNIALGNKSGLSTISGSNNIFLGNQASAADGVVDPTVTTPVTIEADSIENSIAIGKGAKISRCNGANIANDTNNLFVGINNPQPKYHLDVSGNLNISGSLRINKIVFQVQSSGDSEEGDNQLSLSSGILSQGPNIITDKTGFLTISDSDPTQKQNFEDDYNYDFQVVNRNMKFSNYPPAGEELNLYPPDNLPFESPSFASKYTANSQTIPDYPIEFDGNITFTDSYNAKRQTDQGFNVKSMDANFDQNLTINKKLIIQNLNQKYIHVKTIEITLSQNQADILNGNLTDSNSVIITSIPIDEGTINMHSIFETKTDLSISNGSGSGAVVDVVMTDSTNIQSITVKTSGSGYSPNDTITISYEPDPLVKTPYEAFVVDPGKIEDTENGVITQASVNPTMISNVDTTFTNDVSFNEYDLSGNPNVVNFNGKNVFFTHVDGEVKIIKDLVVNGDVTVNGSITRTPGVGDPDQASTLQGNQLIQGNVTIEDPNFVVSDTYVHKGFDVSANTHIRGHLTVDGDFNFEKAVLKNMIQEDHQTIRMSERVIIENNDTVSNNTKTIEITLSQNQADILNGTLTDNDSNIITSIPIDEGTITIPTTEFPTGRSTNLQISGGSGSGAIVDVVMTDTTNIQSITVTTSGSGYSHNNTITISTIGFIDAPALHVTQHGDTHNIAEFYDGNLSGNSLQGLVMRVANEGVTDIYGRLGINQVPDSNYDLDVLGKTRIKDETRILNNVYIGSTESTPLCTLDISATDAIQIPVGETNERPTNNNIGMLRYNSELGQIEYYGKGTSGNTSSDGNTSSADANSNDADGWQNIAAGGRITSTHNAYISVGVDNNNPVERLMVDISGNVRIGEGRKDANARLHIDGGSSNDAVDKSTDFIMLRRGDADSNNNFTKISSRKTSSGEAIDIKTNTSSSEYKALTILPEGQIGMGTTDPSGNLHVIDSSDCDVIFESGNTNKSTLKLKDAGDSASFEYDGSTNKINIYHTSVDNTKKMTMLPSGYIGIGTMSPATRLHINETNKSDVLRLTNVINSITHQADFKLGQYKDVTDSSMLELKLHDSNSAIMRIRSDGKVGINVADDYIDSNCALQVTNGDIVLGDKNADNNRKVKMIGFDRDTFLTHTGDNNNEGKFIISQTVSSVTTTPLSIGQRDVTFDVNDSSNTSEDGSFDISGGAFNFTGRTFKINDLTIEDDSTSSLTELKTTSNDIEIVNSDGNKIEIDANGVNIGLNNTTNNSDVFSVGTTFTVDTSGNVDASGNIVVGGTGKFGNALIDGSSDAVFGFNNYISSISINTTGSNYNENDSITITDSSGNTIVIDTITATQAGLLNNGPTTSTFDITNITSYSQSFVGGTGLTITSTNSGSGAKVDVTVQELSIRQTSTGATTFDGATIHFNIAGTSQANINSSGNFSINDVTISKGTAQFDNGGLHVSSASTQNLIITATEGVTADKQQNFGSANSGGDGFGKEVLYNTTKNSFGVEVYDVYISNKKFHVTGNNSAPKGMLIDPTDSNNQIVTIEGNLRVNGKVFSNDIETDITATSIVAAVEGIGYSTDQLYIGKSQGESAGNNIQPNTYVTIAGNNNLHSMWAYGPVVSEQYFAATSDINLKENIFTINSALDKTNRMRGVYFNKKGSDKREVGVIAQEVEKVFPELVTGEEGKKTVAYANLTGVLIEAVKELARENTSQATEIDSLKAKVDGLTNNIQQLWEHKRADDNRMKNELAELKREIQNMKRNN